MNNLEEVSKYSESNKMVEDLVLDLINIGTDKINYKILKMLPTDIKTVMKELNLTKMPVYVRANELERVELIKRKNGTGKLLPTERTTYFMNFIDIIKSRTMNYLFGYSEHGKKS